ncbi:MAG TPA: PaaI family thioesterase [Polyangiales bacterium]|nr:PaaI family thioesterase [Polyangiales bacterium]
MTEVEGVVRGETVVLTAGLPELDGRPVRITIEPIEDEPATAEELPPMARLIGRSVVSASPDGTVELRFEGSPRFCNRFGTIQGGMLAAMLDSALAHSAMAALGPGQSALTVEMSTRFFRPTAPGTITARASLLHRSSQLAHAQADLFDSAGVRLAHATGSMRIADGRS